MAAARLRVSVSSPDATDRSTHGLAAWLAAAAPASARGEVSVAMVSDRRMRSLNRQFRGKDAVTDVLSFPFDFAQGKAFDFAQGKPFDFAQGKAAAESPEPRAGAFLGDIVIASGVARRQAREMAHAVRTEVRVLALHGLLHLLGYDHESDNGRMRRVEARLRKRAGLREGLIERSR